MHGKLSEKVGLASQIITNSNRNDVPSLTESEMAEEQPGEGRLYTHFIAPKIPLEFLQK